MAIHSIGLDDFCRIWGCSPSDVPPACIAKLQALNTGHRLLTAEERDEHVLGILKRLQSPNLSRTPTENLQAFESGWNETLQMCLLQGVSADTLKPKYVRPYTRIRYNGDFITPENPFLNDELLSIATSYSFRKYLAGTERIYEFGCGTGRYLFELSDIFPQKSLVGLDWTDSSKKILQRMAQTGRHVKGIHFDMLNPDNDLGLKPGSAVVTIGAMEQLGDSFGPFLSYLLAQNPQIVIHHEPIKEFYDENVLFDYLAILYHDQRRYLSGFWGALQQLAHEGRLEILDGRRLYFGDPYHESASFIAWTPKG